MTPSLKPLAEQVILITGASSGIGLVTARIAAARGARVMLVARDEAVLAEVVAGIEAAGGQAAYAVADVGLAEEVEAAAAAAAARFGRIDTWVNNAGTAIYARLRDLPHKEHKRLFRTNYFGVVNGCVAAIPRLEAAGGGALITVASIVADMPTPVMGAYAATKHAVKAYVESLRIELGEAGTPISVTLIKPSGIDTPVGQHAVNHEGGEAQIPPPAYAPELVAEAILQAAEHPRRAITVGGAGRAQVLFSQHFPTLYERIAPLFAKTFLDPRKAQPTPPNLFAPAHGGEERSGEAAPRERSLYTAASLHPAVTAVVLGGSLVAAVALLAPKRKR